MFVRLGLGGAVIVLAVLAFVVVAALAMLHPQRWLWLFDPFRSWRPLLLVLFLILYLLSRRDASL